MKKLLLLPLLLFTLEINAKDGEPAKCEIGNFALSMSQQPGPLISFGQNIIGRNQTQLYLFSDAFLDKNQHFVDVVPQILYAITDNFSVFFTIPFAASYKTGSHHSAGIEDLTLQLEYAFFAKQSGCSSDQATIVANVSFPTGSSHKNPATGFGAPTYFIGTTYNHTWTRWYCFTSYGVQLPTAHHGTRFGNQFLYQFGLGRNFSDTHGWILDWLVEIDGTFSERDKFHGRKNRNSGGNVIYVTPSLWASSKDWILQFGAGYAVQQHLFGSQKRNQFLLVLDIGRTF